MAKRLAGLVLGLGCIGAGAGAQAPPPAASLETRTLAGLEQPGRIVVDNWGIAHVYGATTHDAFFLQGYNAARDRLWQIDLWRKRGLGRLSASFGPAFIDQDSAARLFLYRGDMAAEWSAYPAEAKAWTKAFADGVNAYVQEVAAGRRPLPVEFRLTGSRPERWSADDIVRIRSHTLVSNLTAEVARAQSLCLGGLRYEPLRRKLEPAHVLQTPAGLDPCVVTPDALKTYLLATEPVRFEGKTVVAVASDARQLADVNREIAEQGSNNWVIAPSHSTTGRPILANDPHREHAVPSLRYLVQIDAPDIRLIGAGEPALPGVSFGHNDDVAWGLTIFPADQQDLYVYRLSPDNPDAYAYKDGWERMTVVRETLEVKGQPDRQIELRFTRHGPVIDIDPAHGRAFAVRSVWSAPGGAGYFNATWMFRAQRWSDFETAHAHWGAPPLNLVYADRSGDIGWLPSAFVPVRPNWDGLSPVPGDGRYEWDGFLKPDLLPSAHNPAKGWFATANEMNLPPGYPNENYKISFEWTDRSRIDRIDKVLSGKPRLGLNDSEALQTDTHSTLALRALALLQGVPPDDADQAAALKLLQGWDGNETADSAQAALFEVWITRHLRSAAVAQLTPAALHPAFDDPQPAAVLSVLESPLGLLGADSGRVRAAILKSSLGAAFAETRARLGADVLNWRWGLLHHATFSPAVAAVAKRDLAPQLSVGPLQIGGSASTPMATSYKPSNFDVVAGASVRMVLDVGRWDNSVVVNTPGQSGDSRSAHYRDLFPIWAAGGYVPLLYSREAVLRNAETVIDLQPSQR